MEPRSSSESQIRRDHPLNLSISISGGKETNKDSPSNGERSGNSSSLKSLAGAARELWPGEAAWPRLSLSKLTWKGTSERVRGSYTFLHKIMQKTSIPPLSISDQSKFSNAISSECPPELLCSEEEVLDLLLSLDTTKANGPDGISATMLKATASSIASSVAFLSNRSIQLGALPEEWKLSAVNPIPKSGAKDSPKNYRPISLLSILSKLLEKHMHSLILGHLQSVSPLASQQCMGISF